jgi:hypothetical protein
MKNSQYIKSVEIDDPNHPNQIIRLDIHKIDGGFIGIESSFTEEVANYIANPYQDCELVKLTDSLGNDEDIDPPLEEDELVGFLSILVAIDKTSQMLDEKQRELLFSGIAKRAGLPPDRLNILFGLAKQCLEQSTLYQFQRILRDDPKRE